VQGLVFPLQVLLLKLFLNKDCIVLAQHHGERPFKNRVKKTLQAYADKAINGYLFTATGNAEMWVNADIIANKAKCHQVLEAATFFTRIDKAEAIKTTGMDGSVNFLWVGRLNENKDPITVLNAFGIYASKNPGVRLYMIYQDGKLLPEVVSIIKESAALANSITLVGKTEHSELPNWYSAADYLLSGSHREGSGYALIEAMACGCVPVVTDIPPFKAITNAGMYGYFYTPGDTQALYLLLDSLAHDKHKSLSDEIVQYSREHLSFCKIADDIHLVYKTIKTGRSAP
jgi:glycosyltransferase involved in cell wall biosynthesis